VTRSKAPYTDGEMEAFDDGFMVAAAIARQALVSCLWAFKSPSYAADTMKMVQQHLDEWLEAVRENDK
jgi:hypothetical protein